MVNRTKTKQIKPVSMSTEEAVMRHPGISKLQFTKMCLKGKRLERVYGNDPPAKELNTALFAKKVGKRWMIPIEELNRVFTP